MKQPRWIWLVSAAALVLAAACDDDGDKGLCFVQCPSDEWISAHLDVDGGDGYGTGFECGSSNAGNAAECEEFAAEEQVQKGVECTFAWVEGCTECDGECAPDWYLQP